MHFKLILFLLFFGFAFLFPPKSFAEKINNFDVVVRANEDGSMNITENIEYDFESEYKHGIFRYIPLYLKVGNLYRIMKIDNLSIERDGKKEKFEKSTDSEQIYLKIGNADKTINGEHNYKISYTVSNGISSNYADHDEIYWNVTGNGWKVPIEKASLSLKTYGPEIEQAKCFISVGKNIPQLCSFDKNNLGLVKSGTTIYPGNGLTVVYGFPINSFPKSILSTEPPMSFAEKFAGLVWKFKVVLWLFLNIALPIVILFWYQKKKNKKRFGEPVVNFEIPKDEKKNRIYPAMAGAIDSSKLERDDILATIFDLAIRKYIKLEEEKLNKKLGIFGKDKKQKIVKLKDKDKNLNKFEEILFNRLFESGDQVYVETLKTDFYTTFGKLELEIFRDLVDKKYYVKNPKVQKGLLLFLGFFVLFFFNFILAGVLFYLSKKLNGRTAIGDEIDYKIDGLKLFLKSMDRNYKWQAEKFYTVEQMIPYAVALGYIDEFMEQLKIIKPDYNPSWYSGASRGFYVFYPAFTSSISSNMITSAPSSSSGFSGGSSGGGGGGGGGGSW